MSDPNEQRISDAFPQNIPGTADNPIGEVADLDGVWIIRFGLFGWADEDLRGGVLLFSGGVIFGGSSNYLYRGKYALEDGEVRGSLRIDQHGSEDAISTIYGDRAVSFSIEFTAQPISTNRLEGYFHRDGHPDARIVYLRFRDEKITPYKV